MGPKRSCKRVMGNDQTATVNGGNTRLDFPKFWADHLISVEIYVKRQNWTHCHKVLGGVRGEGGSCRKKTAYFEEWLA